MHSTVCSIRKQHTHTPHTSQHHTHLHSWISLGCDADGWSRHVPRCLWRLPLPSPSPSPLLLLSVGCGRGTPGVRRVREHREATLKNWTTGKRLEEGDGLQLSSSWGALTVQYFTVNILHTFLHKHSTHTYECHCNKVCSSPASVLVSLYLHNMHTRIVSGAQEGRGRGTTQRRRLISENSLEEREDIGVCVWGVGVWVSQRPHLFSTGGYGVPRTQSSRWPCLGSCHLPARGCVQGPSP